MNDFRGKWNRPIAGCVNLGVAKPLSFPPQSLNEFYFVATRRLGLPRDVSTRDRIWTFSRWCTAPLDVDAVQLAWSIESETGYHYFDCVLLASALRSGCSFFLSEDLQHGRHIGGLTIVNPFTTSPHDHLPSI
jgi:predicted nucleic acid-binding protein